MLEKSARHIRLAIQNPAPNLTQENIQYLFDRFYRADSARSPRDGGHGIGLSIAKAIADAHGGKISATLKSNELTIAVFLPAPKH